jgi:hypothetical protein
MFGCLTTQWVSNNRTSNKRKRLRPAVNFAAGEGHRHEIPVVTRHGVKRWKSAAGDIPVEIACAAVTSLLQTHWVCQQVLTRRGITTGASPTVLTHRLLRSVNPNGSGHTSGNPEPVRVTETALNACVLLDKCEGVPVVLPAH